MRQRLGVILGRFQTPYLHHGHSQLFTYVRSVSDRLVVFLGIPAGKPGIKDPLDFWTRETLIKEHYRDATVLPIQDCGNNDLWSQTLDISIRAISSGMDVTLYGGRDSFIPSYTGRYKTNELINNELGPGLEVYSARKLRETVRRKTTVDFREGVIHAVNFIPPRIHNVVDMAVINGDSVLLGMKSWENRWRFPGGFVDEGDTSFEDAARRELAEETGLLVNSSDIVPICSRAIDDWRYRGGPDKVVSSFYLIDYKTEMGSPQGGDDLAKVGWFKIGSLGVGLAYEHEPLYAILEQKIKPSLPGI